MNGGLLTEGSVATLGEVDPSTVEISSSHSMNTYQAKFMSFRQPKRGHDGSALGGL